MHPTGLTGRLARISARHPWTVIATWIVVLAIALTTMVTLGNRFTMNEEFRVDLESRVANDLIAERLNGGAEDPAQERVIVSSTDMTVEDPAFEAVVANVAAELAAHDEVARVETYYDAGQDALVSFDRHRTVIVTTLAGDPVDAIQDAQPVLKTIHDLQTPAPGFDVVTLGAASITDTVNTTAEAGMAKGESIGIVVALIVMAVVFGTLVAAGIPIVLTIVTLLVTTSVAMATSHILGLNAAVIQMIDVIHLARDYLPIVIGFVLIISFLLLLVAFRSIVVPIKAIVMNLLSVFASYGLLVLIFQKGFGARLLGFQQVAQIEAFVLLFLFCVLFGLSMDYHVFLFSRIKEQFDLTGDNELAVTRGLQSTGRLITSAALIMVGVFGGFAAADLANLQQFGFGLAAAVFLDATIVRMILVPASMTLLGNRNWYLPAWLSWLPEIHIDGAPPRVAPESLDRDTDGPALEPALAD